MSAKYHIQVKLYKEEGINKHKFVKGFNSLYFNETVAEWLYEKINKLTYELYALFKICNAFERVYGKEEKNCKYHFKIEEHGSCYSLDKIVFNGRCSSIATIWFNDIVPDSNMLSKEKAYEIIQNIKKHLEEVNE